MLFCTQCGAPVERKIPEGDDHERYVCTACGEIFYENPLNIVGTVPVWEDKVLLCRRAIKPRKGYWTLPAGHQEMKETTRDGAARETREEAGIDFRIADEPLSGSYTNLYIASQFALR
ncbi:NUDIX hydrolase, partial [Parasutterella sp.]|uniref:NUDIX hydrolase n=2 Tax=Parasutterella sp. TaxID=2049037 RepID=UPI00307B2F4A